MKNPTGSWALILPLSRPVYTNVFSFDSRTWMPLVTSGLIRGDLEGHKRRSDAVGALTG